MDFLPPMDEVKYVLQTVVAPAAAVAAVVYLVSSLLPWIRRSGLPIALAIGCGFVAGNWNGGAVDFRLNSDHRLTAIEFGQSLQAAVKGEKPEGVKVPPTRYWLPWIVAAGLIAAVVKCAIKSLGWLMILAVAGVSGWLVSPAETQNQHITYTAVFTLLAVSIWWLLDDLDAGGLLPFVAALHAGAAGMLMLFCRSKLYFDIGVITSSALMGIAVVAWWFRGSVAGVATIPALGIPALMLVVQRNSFGISAVPAISYSLMAAAPLALGVLSLPASVGMGRRTRTCLTIVLWLIPAAISIYLASRVEQLEFAQSQQKNAPAMTSAFRSIFR